MLIPACVLLYAPLSQAAKGITAIPSEQCALMKERNVITDKNPVACERLATVSFSYVDFEGKTHKDGEVVVLDILAAQVRNLFAELLLYRVPIAMAKPLEFFNGSDEQSMAANNTSAFNGRPITGGRHWSKHAYGVAIDINPLQNPYIATRKVNGVPQQIIQPPQSASGYMARTPVVSGMAEEMTSVFYKHGFLIWGGQWKSPVDYQHFEVGSMKFVKSLAAMPRDAGQAAFNKYVDAYRECIVPAVNKGRSQRKMIYDNCRGQHVR